MTTSTAIRPPPRRVPDPKPMVLPGRSIQEQIVVKIFVLIPFVALIAAVPFAWGWGLGWTDLGLAAGFYVVACLGVTVGYHRRHHAFRDLRIIDRLFPLWMGLSLGLPAVLHHVTWSINSICHMIGDRPFVSRDKAANFWPLAILSMGESWHNSHHADPTCARHGVRKGQIDISARVIRILENLRWASDVHWTNPERLARITIRT